MRKISLILFFAAFGMRAFSQDLIIYRDGRVREAKIVQTNNDKTLFKESDSKRAAEEYVDNSKVFMLKFKTRGNVVFNGKGERILTTSESVQMPKDAIIVYYKDGREVPAYNLTMDADNLSFRTSKSKKKSVPVSSPKSEVFMISYPDGTRDILTDIVAEEDAQRKREEEELRLKAEREAAQADSIAAAAEDENAASATNPKRATIVTKTGGKLKVWICSNTPSAVSYKKVNSPKAAIFKMSKAKIKNIIY